jgi:hypothetical protein
MVCRQWYAGNGTRLGLMKGCLSRTLGAVWMIMIHHAARGSNSLTN